MKTSLIFRYNRSLLKIRIVNNIHVHEQSDNGQIQYTVSSHHCHLALAVFRLGVARPAPDCLGGGGGGVRAKESPAILSEILLGEQNVFVAPAAHQSNLECVGRGLVFELRNVGLGELNIGNVLNESDSFVGHFLACWAVRGSLYSLRGFRLY